MLESVGSELRDQIRGVTGALLVLGLTYHYTMETWWLAWTLPISYIFGFAVLGLALVVVATRASGFRHEERNEENLRNSGWELAIDFTEILFQSFVASYSILFVLGIIDHGTPLNIAVRLGLLEVVPLGIGAALANKVFGGESEKDANEEMVFPKNLGIFAIGSLFVAGSIAPTQEIELITTHMGWPRYLVLVVLTLVLVYLILYELDFKDQEGRIAETVWVQIGTTCIVYAVGVTLSFFMLLGFGHFISAPVIVMYQESVTLAFPASLGGAAAEVLV